MANEVATAPAPTFQLSIPAPTVVVPDVVPEPAAPATDYMATVVTQPAVRQGLVCYETFLPKEQLPQARAVAKQVYQQMVAQPSLQMTYGHEALDGLNALVNRLLHEVEPTRVPELNKMLGDLNAKMSGIKHKYDVTDPKFRKQYEDSLKGAKGLFHRSIDFIARLKGDVVDIEKQLDSITEQLTKRQYQMTRNVEYYTQLYAENEVAIQGLIQVIAILELVVEVAEEDAKSIVVGDAAQGDRGAEERAKRTDLIDTIKVKIGDLKGRLFVAWATGPQTRMMRKLDIGMAAKLSTLVQSTIPTMKETLLEWRMAMQALENAQMSEAIIATNNQWLTEFYSNAAQIMPTIEQAIQQPVVWPETMHAIADSLNQAADGVLQAFQAGEDRRKEVDAAMMDGARVLQQASGKIDDAILGRITTSAMKPVPEMLALPAGRS